MSNKYIYLSSLGSRSHSDFEVNFPTQLQIKPYSQVRCISCRVNPSDNLLEIDETNDLFYVGVDHWNKKNCNIPLLPIRMRKGLYDLEDGDNDIINLNAGIESQLNKQIQPYCFLRGGAEVSIASRKLKLKMSTMQLYGMPTKALTDASAPSELVNYWSNFKNSTEKFLDGARIYPISQTLPVQLEMDTNFYGLEVHKTEATPQYYISPPIVTGLTSTADNAPHSTFLLDFDFTGLAEEDEVGAPQTKPEDFFRFYYGDCRSDSLGDKWGAIGKINEKKDAKDKKVKLANNMHFYVEFSNKFCVIRYRDPKGTQTVYNYSGQNGYTLDNKFVVGCVEWEDAHSSWMGVEVQMKKAGDADYSQLLKVEFQKQAYRHKHFNNSNRIGMIFNTKLESDKYSVKYSASVDDPNDVMGFNPTTDAWGARASLSADIPDRLMTVVTDTQNVVDILDMMYQKQVSHNMTSSLDSYVPDLKYDIPNADILSWDSDTDWGFVVTSASNTGLDAEGAISGNNREFPMFFLSLPDLPLKNFSANYLQGYENHFLTPIELSLSQTSQRLYTSKMYTRQYNTLHNASPMNLSSMKVKICDINGAPVEQLDKYTIIALEIRENPHLRKMKEFETLQRIAENTQNTDQQMKLVGDQ